MKISPELVVGNVLLSVFEKKGKSVSYSQIYHCEKKLNKHLKDKNKRLFSSICSADIVDTVGCFPAYLTIEKNGDIDSDPRIVVKNNGDVVCNKLDLYYRSLTPKWLVSDIKEMVESK